MSDLQNDPNPAPGLFDNFSDTAKEIFAIETKKTRKSLLVCAVVILLLDAISLAIQGILFTENFLIILVVPLLFTSLAFLAMREPMVSIVLASIIMAAVWTYTIVIWGAMAVLSGWLAKAVIIYQLIAGFQHAREAQRAKKEIAI